MFIIFISLKLWSYYVERLLKLTKKYDSVGKEEKSQSADEMCQLRILFSMLHNVEEISEKELKILLNTIWRPYVVKPDLITLIMEILHQRSVVLLLQIFLLNHLLHQDPLYWRSYS